MFGSEGATQTGTEWKLFANCFITFLNINLFFYNKVKPHCKSCEKHHSMVMEYVMMEIIMKNVTGTGVIVVGNL